MSMSANVLDFEEILEPDDLAAEIAGQWREWNNFRSEWMEEKKELRNYLFATDTNTTTNSSLPWSNSTTTPKLTQIRDNLHANYMATLIPNSKWISWEASDRDSNTLVKKDTISAYMYDKIRKSDFEVTISKLLTDWIDYGNCFAKVDFVRDHTVLEDGEVIGGFTGPRLDRISPFDIAFNPAAANFKDTPKIVKSIMNLGDIKKAIEEDEANEHLRGVFDKMITVRNVIRSSDSEIHKSEGYVADGFSNITMYYDTDYVEILTFYGSIYDKANNVFKRNRIITIADRAHILSDEPNPSWLGEDPIYHVGWRERPDNLYAMGPLDNLVGLQYRIDHLENLKADVFDQIAWPVQKIRGDVDDYEWYPGCKIFMGDSGDVEYLRPEPTALNADLQIERLTFIMEEMAGAPRQAMGIRTPGEKTAFEVGSLENAANRIFNHKTAHFERVFLEPALNAMLEAGRRNLVSSEDIQVVDDSTGATFFQNITREDINGNGKVVPVGARHFAERNTRIQNLSQLIQLKVSDPSIGAHLSGKLIAKLLSEELGEADLFLENVAIQEQLETAQAQEDAAVEFEEQQQISAEQGL